MADWHSEPVWLGDGEPPAGVLIYRNPSGSYGIRASDCRPINVILTRLWQDRMLAQLAGMMPGDEGWPGMGRRKRRAAERGQARGDGEG